jgi:predicted RNase H-like HicB family nuclease
MIYKVIVEEDKLDGGFIAKVSNLKGGFSDGNTMEELVKNIKEAIETIVEDSEYDIEIIKNFE